MTVLSVFINTVSKLFLTKKIPNIKIDTAASSEDQGKLTCLMRFQCFSLFTRGRKPSYLVYPPFMIRLSPKEITQHQTLVRTAYNVYED
jgi:hypothetical protein